MGIKLDIVIEDVRWKKIPRLRARFEEAAEAVYAELPKSVRLPCSVTILLTGNTAVRRLNRDFRGIDRPTNVLSFPQFEPAELTKKGKNRGGYYAGDIALGYQYIVVESKKEHKILINHTIHLIIHGILHLFGYDHQLGAQAVRMERLEKRVMTKLDLPDPYAP